MKVPGRMERTWSLLTLHARAPLLMALLAMATALPAGAQFTAITRGPLGDTGSGL